MGNHPSIMRASMDGKRHLQLLASELDRPGPLAIDVEGNKLYWADSRLNRIECSDLSGGNRKNLVNGVSNPRGIAILGNFLFWSDEQHQTITRADKITGENRSIISKGLEKPSDLKVVGYFETKYLNPCAKNKTNCSHICVIEGGKKARCSCPMGQVLHQDQKTCHVPSSCAAGCSGGLSTWLIIVISIVVTSIVVIPIIVVTHQRKIPIQNNVQHNQENRMKLLRSE
jgi:hypothetical protein